MARSSRALLVVACAAAIACGPDPDVRHPVWEDHFNRANRATADSHTTRRSRWRSVPEEYFGQTPTDT